MSEELLNGEYITMYKDWLAVGDVDEEIIHCRDCVHYEKDPNPIDPGWPMWCSDTGREMVAPDGYCAWGVRR